MQSIQGVGLLLLNKKNQFYAIEELVKKQGAVCKNPGELSIPLETLNEDEQHEDAILRLYQEEVDQNDVVKTTIPIYIGNYVVQEEHLRTTVFLYLSLVTKWNELPFAGSHAGTEYLPYGFVSEEELLSHGRAEMKEIFAFWRHYCQLVFWSGG